MIKRFLYLVALCSNVVAVENNTANFQAFNNQYNSVGQASGLIISPTESETNLSDFSPKAEPDNAAFQQFDNQFNIGFGATSGYLATPGSGAGQTIFRTGQATYDTQFVNLEFEHLFDMGLWFDIDNQELTAYSQNGAVATGTGANGNGLSGNPTGAQPQFWGLNAKIGYAFQPVTDHLQLIPYGIVGRNSNYSGYTLNNQANLTQNYFYTLGLGGRMEYRINDYIDLYFDQSLAYNMDMSPTTSANSVTMNNYLYTSTIGAKFNVCDHLQLGVNGFYNYYQPNTAIPNNLYVPAGQLGGIISVGYAY